MPGAQETAAAGPDDGNPGLSKAVGVGSQRFRSGVVLQSGTPPSRNTGIGFGYHRDIADGGPDSDHRGLGVGQVRTTVGADAGHPELS